MKKRILALTLSIIFLGILMVGCSGGNQDSQTLTDAFQDQIMFNGSSTLAPVIAKIAADFNEEYGTWNNVDSSFPEKDIYIYVSSGGSGFGVKSVIEKTADFGMVAREVKDSEKDQLPEYQEIIVGIDALTIAVNPKNKIWELKGGLSTEEIQKIFSGEVKYWNEVHPDLPEREIVLLIRDLGGGASQVFQDTIMGDIEVSPNAIQAPSMGTLVNRIIENEDAIGYASVGGVNSNPGKIIPLEVDGIAPTDENIISGEYKIFRPLIIMKNGALSESEQAFVDYIKSEKGAKVIEEMGFVPVN